jgi:hypothetical protein
VSRSARAALEVSLTKVLFVVMSQTNCVVLTDTRWVELVVSEQQLIENAIARLKDTDVLGQSFDTL